MRIIAADSACSTLDPSFMPKDILNTAVVLLDDPYGEPVTVSQTVGDYRLTDPNVLIYELRLSAKMLETQHADAIHLDFNFGGMNVLGITEEMIERNILSRTGREILRLALPELQSLALSIGEKYKVPVYALGDQSVAVRTAELHAAAGAVARMAQRALTSEAPVIVGLPRQTKAFFEEGRVSVHSLDPMEDDLTASAEVDGEVNVQAFLNPVAKGFQVLRFSPGG
jgi:hypothetical protein